jgi:hypothetical protein
LHNLRKRVAQREFGGGRTATDDRNIGQSDYARPA